MPIDLDRLRSFTTSSASLAGLALVVPRSNVGYQAQASSNSANNVLTNNTTGNGPSFLFHIEEENTVNLTSNITDHFAEDNTALNDHISLAPETITVRGLIGELTDIAPESIQSEIDIAEQKLLLISEFTPELTVEALRQSNETLRLFNAARVAQEQAAQTFATINGNDINTLTGTETPAELEALANNRAQTEQQLAFQHFYSFWRNRTLFTIQTPWAVFRNVAIQSLKTVQEGDTEDVSSFEITFKILRFVGEIESGLSSDVIALNNQSRLATQAAPVADFGVNVPEASISFTEALA